MVIIMEANATEANVEAVIGRLISYGLNAHRTSDKAYTAIGAVGDTSELDVADFQVMFGVREAYRISSPRRLSTRTVQPEGTVVKVGEVEIGGDHPEMIVGPPEVTEREEFEEVAGA